MHLLERLEQHLVRMRLMPRGARVVVAVSGGVDSMVLLHALHQLAPGFGWKLSVAHFNHRLRGRSSDADERLVRATARRLNLRCDVASANVRATATKRGVSIEMAARELRHAFLARCARERGAKFVALAHHADDQAELFLLRLLRGAGGEGLGGMKARSVSPADKRVLLVRPLLELSKDEVKAFARAAKLTFREDASNASAEFERNWIRLELLPQLRRRQPAVVKNIVRTMEIVGAEADFVALVSKSWHERGVGRGEVAMEFVPVAVQRRVVQSQLRAFGVEPEFQLVESLRLQPGGKVSVAPGVALVCDEAGRVRRVRTDPAFFESGERIVALSADKANESRTRTKQARTGTFQFGGLRLNWRMFERAKSFQPKRAADREFFDAGKVGAWLRLRHWRAGDRFQPIGMASATKLQDWFTNRKVPAARRRTLVLAETERGEIFWVQGERIGEVAKLTPQTRTVLELKWKQL